MSLGVVIEGMTIAAFMILLLGGKQRREQGWAVLSIMVAIAAVVQAAGMSLTVRRNTISHNTAAVDELITCRRISMTMTHDSSLAGSSTNRGSCAPSAGASKLFARLQLRPPL